MFVGMLKKIEKEGGAFPTVIFGSTISNLKASNV
jgi:hypothetical protein